MQKSQLFIHIRKSHLFKQVELYFCPSSQLWGIQLLVANKKSYIFIYIYIYNICFDNNLHCTLFIVPGKTGLDNVPVKNELCISRQVLQELRFSI